MFISTETCPTKLHINGKMSYKSTYELEYTPQKYISTGTCPKKGTYELVYTLQMCISTGTCPTKLRNGNMSNTNKYQRQHLLKKQATLCSL